MSEHKPMRVLFFFENRVLGGGSKYVLDCINATFQVADEVRILTNADAFTLKEIEALGKPILQSTIKIAERGVFAAWLFGETHPAVILRKLLALFTPLFLFMNIAKIYGFLKEKKPDLLVSCNGGYPAAESSLAAVLAAKCCNIPSILVVMSEPMPRRRFLLGYDRLLDYLVFSSVEHVIANSSLQLRELTLRRTAPASKLIRVYNGVKESGRVPNDRRIAPGKRPIIIGVTCRLTKLKGVDFLIEAVGILNTTPGRVELHIIGDGEAREELLSQTARLGLEKSVRFFGHLSGDLETQINGFDIFAFPSLHEGLPYSILEALRAGLPIVTTNVGGIPEAIRNGIEGILVPPHSAAALATGISQLLDDPKLAAQLGANARLRYGKIFVLEKTHKEFSRVIRDVARFH